ncbi:tyrosine-type recombinase/integrase [Rhodococcus erythropolis]|uniref:tyrosine-type recombinase/integrase n=1 Tax=Rhodococcus erythropolis TaxID=1833 RepID=UPI003804982C
MYLGAVKTHESRTVPLPQPIAADLHVWCKSLEPDDLVFSTKTHGPLRNKNYRRDCLTPAAESVGLVLTPHNLRDTAASLAIDAGASVVAVARLLGHEDATTTLRHYAALFPTDLADLVKRVETKSKRAMERHRESPVTTQ